MEKLGIANDKYFDATASDIRDSKEFKTFKQEVLNFITEKESVTWRMLNEKFYYNAYWLTMAVDLLDGKFVKVEAEKIPERIVIKKCEHKWNLPKDWDGNVKSTGMKKCARCGFEQQMEEYA